ncbi:MAG TPA: FTR1 family protein [Acidimicrobiales bacterium]|nr:FTR1 family protein [Acidimicrobiales bacterium]
MAAFVIFLREGIEASIIVAILLSALDRMGRRDHFKDVIAGVGAALILVLGGGVAAYLLIKTYSGSRTQTIFETVTYLVAAVALTYMTFWMRRHAPKLSAELREKAAAAMDGRTRWGLGLLSFQAVGREGLETMVFTLAIVFASSGHGVIVGGVGGLAVALVVAFAIYHLGKRINIGLFFTAVGALLMVFAAGILVDAVQNLQELGWLPILTHPLWNTGHVLSEDSSIGDVFHSFFGYAQQPTVGQLVVYLTYVVLAVGAFIGLGRRQRPTGPSSPPAMPRAAGPAPAVATASASSSANGTASAGPARGARQREGGAVRS